jgi:hypothetical protein
MAMRKITDAEKARLKKLSAGKGAMADGSLSMDQKMELNALKRKARQATSYSPAPMSAAAKAKAGARGKATQAKVTARNPKAGTSTLAAVAKRFGVTAREARDIYTAVGSAAQAVRKSPQENMPVSGAFKNVGKQIKEVAKAAATGKKGTTAYKITPNRVSKENRKREGNKGYVFYDIKNPKQR